MNGFVSLEAGEETFRETLSARVNVSSAINGRISTHAFGLALAGGYPPRTLPNSTSVKPCSPKLGLLELLFQALPSLEQGKAQSCPCKRTDARALHQAGMGITGRWLSKDGSWKLPCFRRVPASP